VQRLNNIDSLRTIAAALVFLYHVDLISGGFIGVDIFFVISGFIISSIICNHRFNEKFILHFFIARINRLLPAIIILCFISMIFGYFILLPEEINFLAKTIQNSLIFNSNNFFYQNTNYFSEISNSPILHTWTLGLEFQFYIFIIIFYLLFSSHIKFWLILTIFLSLCLAQFGGNLKFQSPYIENITNFFSPIYGSFFIFPTRVFEFLIGTLFFVYSAKIKQIKKFKFLDYFAALIIILSAIYFDRNTPNPSIYNFLICVSAAYLLIAADHNNKGYIEKLLFFKPLYSLGLFTYGFYVWHYTIIFFYKLRFGDDLLFIDLCALITLSSILTYVSFHFLEKPMNNKIITMTKKIYFYLISIFLLILAIIFSEKTSGFSYRIDTETLTKIKYLDDYEEIGSKCRNNFSKNICKHGDLNNLNAVLWGDSHANQLVPVLTTIAEKKGFGFYEYSSTGCPPIKNIERLNKSSQNCAQKTDIIYKKIKDDPKIKNIIIHAYWSYYFDKNHTYSLSNLPIDLEFKTQLMELIKNNKNIFIILSIPEMNTDPRKYFIRNNMFNKKDLENDDKIKLNLKTHKIKNFEFLKITENIKYTNIYQFDPASILCDELNCFSIRDNKILYRDKSHISKKNSYVLYDSLYKFLTIK
jgi:peptidoglycan/LPS O-acetylase OafA/YrhL